MYTNVLTYRTNILKTVVSNCVVLPKITHKHGNSVSFLTYLILCQQLTAVKIDLNLNKQQEFQLEIL